MTEYTSVEVYLDLPEAGDDTNTISYRCLVDFDFDAGEYEPDKWTGEAFEGEVIFDKVQIEISENIWTTLNNENLSFISKKLEDQVIGLVSEGEV